MRVFKISQPRTIPTTSREVRGKKKFQETIQIAATLIKQGKVVVCPTDTVYGLISDAENKKAVRKVFQIKKRRKTMPIPIFVKDIKMAKRLTYINRDQEEFLKKVWPGKVTVVLKGRKAKTKLYGVAKDTIALRIPSYKVMKILLERLNRPLTGTSANISGNPASGNLREVLSQFKDTPPHHFSKKKVWPNEIHKKWWGAARFSN